MIHVGVMRERVGKGEKEELPCLCKRNRLANWEEHLRAKAHKFTLHEALMAKSCGSNVELLIYSF